jgi:hypothetical protein
MTPGTSARSGLAALAFGLLSSAAYVALRIAAAWAGEAAPGAVLGSAHVPYFWRVGLAVFVGGMAASIAGLGADEEEARRWLGRGAVLALPTAVVLVALALAVP